MKQDSRYCPNCSAQVLATAPATNHLLHLVLSVLTAGFWLVIWLLVPLLWSKPYRCTRCGLEI
jgi:hypothetical protein